MNTYLVTVHTKLYSVNRIVQANSKAEAAAQVDQYGAKTMWIEDITGQAEE